MIVSYLLIVLILYGGCTCSKFTSEEAEVHVVIARYKENVDHLKWLENFPHTIYNRGDDLSSTPLHIVDCLENVGRESFIYLSHIVKHYHHLPNITIFSQAVQSVKHLYNEGDFQADVEVLSTKRKYLSPENDGFAFCIPVCATARHAQQMKDFAKKYGEKKAKIFEDGYQDIFHFPIDNPRYSGTGCFFVTREAIHRNPRQYYIEIARLMQSDNDPIEGHFLERAWPEVFHSTCSAGERFHCLFQSKTSC